ncbi:MAG: hypothetical protein WC139_13960 [Candidatus Kapaibacterium sp.]
MKIIIIIISFILLLSINLLAQFQYETIEYGNQISNVTDIYFANPNTGYVMGYLDNNSPKLYKTTNKGASWTVRKDFGNIQNSYWAAAPTISFINANTGWALIGYFSSGDMFTNYCEMLKTNDGGATWSRVFLREYSGPPPTTEIYGPIKFIDESTGYLIDRISRDLMKTTNGGLNWTTIKPVPNVSSCRFNVLEVSPTNPLRLYLGGTKFMGGGNNNPLFYVSNDGGASFQTIYDGTLQNGMIGIYNLTIVNNNNVDLVRLASNSILFE